MQRNGTVRTRRGTEVSFTAVGGDDDDRAAPVLLVHPINLRKECWLDVLPALEADRPCIAIDLADHGESSDSAVSSLTGWVADCRDVVVRLGLERLHVVGGSLGGTIALCLASELPRHVMSVTAMGSSLGGGAHADPDEIEAVRMLDRSSVDELFAVLAVEALAPGAPETLVKAVRRLTNVHGKPIVRRTLQAAVAADATPWVPGVRCPVLVITGEHDTTCPVQEGRRMAVSVGGRHEMLPNTGHLPMLEDAAAVARLVVPHLDSAEAKAGVR
jgi:3-oxoadipate enol-lactonase